jgi:hypothetical protein
MLPPGDRRLTDFGKRALDHDLRVGGESRRTVREGVHRQCRLVRYEKLSVVRFASVVEPVPQRVLFVPVIG